MKKILVALALITGSVTLTQNTAQAQVSFSINIGSQPLWGPTGYDYANYYYMPDIDAYYNVGSRQFICNDGGRWGYYNQLPARYGSYDLYNGYKVVINDRNPWMRNDYYRNQYRGYRGRHGQGIIRDSRDSRYYQIANHPYHNQWRGGRGDGYRGDRGGYYGGRGGYDGRRGGGNDRWDNDDRGGRRGNGNYQGDRGGDNRRYDNDGRGQGGNRGDYSGGDRIGRGGDDGRGQGGNRGDYNGGDRGGRGGDDGRGGNDGGRGGRR